MGRATTARTGDQGPSRDGQLDHDHLERAHHRAIAHLAMHALSHGTPLAELAQRGLNELLELLPGVSTSVLLVDGEELEVRIAAGPHLEGRRLPLDGSVCGEALRTGEVVRIDDVTEDPVAAILPRREGLGPAWAVALGVYSRLRVLLCVGQPEARDNPVAQASIRSVATIIAAAAERQAVDAEVRATEQRFRRLAEQVPDAVFRLRLTPGPRLDYASPRMSELTGLSADELEDLPTAWERIVPEEDQAALRGVDLTSGEVITTPAYRLVRPDGTTRWVESRVAPERDLDGQVVAVSGLTRDITARREGEVALRRTLEREQQAADRLRELAELKDSLLAAVSHELRTPLTAVLGFAEVLRSAGESMEPERRERALMALERNAQRLEQLLADLLDLDRLDRGVIEPARRAADVAAIVASVLDRIEPHPHTHVEAAVPSRIIEVDPAKIERVVENLVVNAMKHSGPRCHVWIRAHDVDGGLLLAVEDDGPGIPDESKTRVFEPFERGDSTSPVPGTGIGLSLVRRFVELHGGRVSVEDRTGGGATFTVWLPDPEPGDQQDGEDADGT